MSTGHKRRANFEFLRLYAILTIMVLHYQSSAGALVQAGEKAGAIQYIGQLLESFCIPTLATFVLITGYFNKDKKLEAKKLLGVLAQVWFYSVGVHLVLRLTGAAGPVSSVWDLAMYFLPVMSVHYWYVTAFVVMEILAPVINTAAAHMKKEEMRTVLIGLFVYISLIKSVVPIHLTADGEGYEFGFFILVYLIAVYMRQYGEDFYIGSAKKGFAVYALCCAVIYAVTLAAHAVNLKTGSFSYFISVPIHLNFVFTLAASVALFRAFSYINIKEGRAADMARLLGPLTFGVYLIHCHVDVMPKWVSWFASLIGGLPENPILFFLWMAVVILIVFAVGACVDLLRKRLFNLAATVVDGNKK